MGYLFRTPIDGALWDSAAWPSPQPGIVDSTQSEATDPGRGKANTDAAGCVGLAFVWFVGGEEGFEPEFVDGDIVGSPDSRDR